MVIAKENQVCVHNIKEAPAIDKWTLEPGAAYPDCEKHGFEGQILD